MVTSVSQDIRIFHSTILHAVNSNFFLWYGEVENISNYIQINKEFEIVLKSDFHIHFKIPTQLFTMKKTFKTVKNLTEIILKMDQAAVHL